MIPNGCVSVFITLVFVSLYTCSDGMSLSFYSRNKSFIQQKIITRAKIKTDMHRIRHSLEPLRSLFNSRNTYRKHYNELETKWNCCPQQRSYLFDIRNIHRYMVGIADCHVFIQNNKNHLTHQCQVSLKSFDPTRGDTPVCDGRLLRNIADKYSFVVQLYNYTKTWCAGGLHPMLIYSNITRIIRCERTIREGLKKNPEAYIAYDNLSSDLLHVYVHNINNYRDCDDPRLWDDEPDDESQFINDKISYS